MTLPALPDETIAASKEMNDGDRNAMIRGMVDRLATRLKQNGDDVEGWLRLVRAYLVLGEHERARRSRNRVGQRHLGRARTRASGRHEPHCTKRGAAFE